jgi:iron complex outermembrane receptor protein
MKSKTGGFARVAKLFLFSALSLFLIAGGAVAAEEEKKEKKDTVKLEAVKVTANKMEEDPMDIPQNITVFSDIDIEEQGIEDIRDIIDNVPGMSYTEAFGTAVNFRGLNFSMFTENNPVSLYIDGVGYSGRSGFDASLVNVQRVEVLHGPQSCLYGKDSLGAAINVITKDPTNTWEGKVGAEGGSWYYGKGLASLNGPIFKDNLYLGFSVQYRRDQGWIQNDAASQFDLEDDANRKRQIRTNGYLLWTPESNDALRIRFSMRHDEDKDYWPDAYRMGARGTTLDSFDAKDAEHVRYDVESWNKVTDDYQTAKIEYEFDKCKLESITSHRTMTTRGVGDIDYTDAVAWRGLTSFDNRKKENWSQEFRLSSHESKGFRWMGGAYADSDRLRTGPYGQELIDSTVGPTSGHTWQYDARTHQNMQTMAVFGQVVVPVYEQFELTLGGRAQRIRNDIDQTVYFHDLTNPAFSGLNRLKEDKTENALLPKAALTYLINDNWTSYLSYSQGYMAGGFNTFATGGSASDNEFKPQKSFNYEWGIKAGYDAFRISADLFYMDIKDIHVYRTNGVMYVTDNAKKAHSMGAEFQVTYKPLETVDLTAGGSVIRARYDDYDASPGVNFKDQRIEMTPDYSLMLSATYRDPSGFYARADGRHYGIRTFYTNDPAQGFTTADPYEVFDARIGYRVGGLDAYAYMKNIFDKGYVTRYQSSGPAGAVAFVGEPRNMGAGVLYHF